MAKTSRNLRLCSHGHKYVKTSSCPVCPVCEAERVPKADFLRMVSAPARRALENNAIKTLRELSAWRETDLLMLHGIGPTAIPKLRKALKLKGLYFKKSNA